MNFDPLNDGISAVNYVDHMGDDLRVVNAARVSLDRQSQFECDETGRWLLEEDEKLIADLAARKHISPFFHPQICLCISMPSYLGKVWWRSNVGVSRSEVFQRYVKASPKLHSPASWEGLGPDAKTREPEAASDFAVRVEGLYRDAEALYEEALAAAIPADMAHMLLPQAQYTSWIETGSLYYFSRMFALHGRLGTQESLRAYADCIDRIASGLFPVSWRALTDHVCAT